MANHPYRNPESCGVSRAHPLPPEAVRLQPWTLLHHHRPPGSEPRHDHLHSKQSGRYVIARGGAARTVVAVMLVLLRNACPGQVHMPATEAQRLLMQRMLRHRPAPPLPKRSRCAHTHTHSTGWHKPQPHPAHTSTCHRALCGRSIPWLARRFPQPFRPRKGRATCRRTLLVRASSPTPTLHTRRPRCSQARHNMRRNLKLVNTPNRTGAICMTPTH